MSDARCGYRAGFSKHVQGTAENARDQFYVFSRRPCPQLDSLSKNRWRYADMATKMMGELSSSPTFFQPFMNQSSTIEPEISA